MSVSNLSPKTAIPSGQQALLGRETPMALDNQHYVHGRPIKAPYSDDDTQLARIAFGLGCFWGAERVFWELPGVFTTAVGYGAGVTANPSYKEVCSGLTGHNELVLVVYDQQEVSLKNLLKVFFESHNPTQGMRQGNDIGTQYRSGIYFLNAGFERSDIELADMALQSYQQQLLESGYSEITTEIAIIDHFYYAEQYHQQYLAKNPNGYCGLGGTGIHCDY